MAADIGVLAPTSDGGVFKNSAMYFGSENNKLNLPDPCKLLQKENDESDPHSSSVPFVFVADVAFHLKSYCMKPDGRKKMTICSEYLSFISKKESNKKCFWHFSKQIQSAFSSK